MDMKCAAKSQKNICTVVFLLLSLFYQPAYSQPCDPNIKEPVKNWKLRYRERGNRCEGFYKSTVSAPMIEVVGTTEGQFQFKLEKNEVLEVSSPIVRDQIVNVRAVGIPDKTYYRMDAQIEPEQTLTWPVAEVLYLEQLSYKKIGVFGWIEEETETIYIPLTITPTKIPGANDGNIRLYLRTSVNVKNVQWRAADATDGICPDLTQIDWDKAPQAKYQEGTPIEITLPSSATGQLCVEVAARDQKTTKWLKKKNIRVIVRK